MIQAYEHIIIRKLTISNGVVIMLLYMNLSHAVFLSPNLIFFQNFPSMEQLLICALMAVMTITINMLILLAFKYTPKMSEVYIFRYLQLPVATIVAWLILGETLDSSIIPYMILIIISSIFLASLSKHN